MPNAVIKSHLPYPNAFMWYNDVATPAFVCITGMTFFVAVDTEMAKTIFSILKTFQMAAVR